MTRPHIVILGGGFGGLAAAKALRSAPVNVTVIDRTNHHLFQPLLYQVATGGLAAPSIAAPIRHILRHQANAHVLMDRVESIDVGAHQVLLRDAGALSYDHLIVATGTTHSYFGQDQWAQHAPGLKTLEDAQVIRAAILEAFERAERHLVAGDHAQQPLRLIVIGAGPTGVEMAGTMAEIALHTLPGEFRKLDAKASEIILIEGGPRVLSTYPDHLSTSALDQLHSLGVKVKLNTKVTSIEAGKVTVQAADGHHESLAADQIIWAAGVKASELATVLATQAGAKLDRSGRVMVDPDLSIPGHSNISVIGDLASLACQGVAVPGVAPAAKQMGQHVAGNVMARLAGQSARPFVYRDYGSMATIGRHRAIAVLGRWHFKGTIAWLLWLFAHIVFLIGFRNRVAVMLDWATQYWTMQRHARIIFQSHKNDPVLPTPSEVVGRAGLEPATKGL